MTRLAPATRRPLAFAAAALLAAVVVLLALTGATPARAAQTITLVGAESNASGPGVGNVTIDVPAGVQAGDVMLAFLGSDLVGQLNEPPGWFAVGQVVRSTVFMRVAGSSEPPSYEFTHSTNPGATVFGTIAAYRGVDGDNPMNARASGGFEADLEAPGVTTTVPDTMLVVSWRVTSNLDPEPPAGMAKRGFSRVGPFLMLVADQPIPGTGATGSRTALGAGSLEGAHTIALRPANTEEDTPPDASVKYQRRNAAGTKWLPYTPGTWSNTIVRAVLTCSDSESGVPDIAAKQTVLFNSSTWETVSPADIFGDCEDRAGNVNDLSGLPDAEIRVDLIAPACFADPSNVNLSPTGEYETVAFTFTATDNFEFANSFLERASSSDGGGDPNPASAMGTPVLLTPTLVVVDAQVSPLATKAGLQRTYRYRVAADDAAGNRGFCQFTVRVK